MRIITWNINSVRIRIPILKKLIAKTSPDILCLQETKVQDADFPLEALKELGFPHIYFSGQKSYNGVAILSKIELSNIVCEEIADSDHKRHIGATLPDGTTLHNFYVPAGGDIPDPIENPAYDYKLRFVEWMTDWSKQLKKAQQNTIIVGDFNIAPYEHDVWSSKQLRKVVSHTEPERTGLAAMREAYDWCDVGRHFTPMEDKLYSWWSYRNRDWKKSNRGRRLDHIWVTPLLKPALKGFDILKETRDWESTSDHVPVIMDLNLSTK
ncbi:MAG: exodeoxyribonuclease III [Rickettsiales bacterium]